MEHNTGTCFFSNKYLSTAYLGFGFFSLKVTYATYVVLYKITHTRCTYRCTKDQRRLERWYNILASSSAVFRRHEQA